MTRPNPHSAQSGLLWRVYVDSSPWATIVVRAPSEEEAIRVGADIAYEYTGSREGVTAERLEPDGPTEVLIVAWS